MEKFEPIEKVIGIGGGSKNLTWLKIKASVLNKVIKVPKVTAGTAIGPALLGTLGAGAFRNEDEVVEKTYKEKTYKVNFTVEPDNRLTNFYGELFEKVHSKLFYSLRELNHTIEALEAKVYGSDT